jgi:hypothetical protein
MKRSYSIMLVVLLSLAVIGTAEAKKKHVQKADPAYPGKAATHTVVLQKVLLSDRDFSRDSTGNPLPIAIEITENGTLLTPSTGDTVLQGTRGERMLQAPVQWLINFSPDKNYQIILTEVVPAGMTGKRIITPATPKQGLWPIGENGGKVSVGQDSYLQFTDKIQ